MGSDGNVVVTWSETTDPEYLIDQSGSSTVYVRGFSPQSVPLWNELASSPQRRAAGNSTVSMDGQDNFVVAWEVAADSDVNGFLPTPIVSEGIYADEYQLENYSTTQPLAAPTVLRNTFRVNSASTNTASQTVWPFDQTAADVQMDIDGDIVTTYQGYGPAVSDDISIPANFFDSYFAVEQQQLTFTDTNTGGIPSSDTSARLPCKWGRAGHRRGRSPSMPTRRRRQAPFKPRW